MVLALTSIFVFAQMNADVLGEWYNEEKDAEAEIAKDIFDNWLNCINPGVPQPGDEFRCVP